jgi:hypothetical protein
MGQVFRDLAREGLQLRLRHLQILGEEHGHERHDALYTLGSRDAKHTYLLITLISEIV